MKSRDAFRGARGGLLLIVFLAIAYSIVESIDETPAEREPATVDEVNP